MSLNYRNTLLSTMELTATIASNTPPVAIVTVVEFMVVVVFSVTMVTVTMVFVMGDVRR
jgi:hypothetical protein